VTKVYSSGATLPTFVNRLRVFQFFPFFRM
jgi:hypothetical protein